MRTIKFRGTRLDNGEWVYGSLAETHGKLFIGISTSSDNPVYMMDWHEVDSNTVGQFTGLLDKHGKEIYEGDILSVRRYDNEFMSESEEFRDAFNIDELKGNEIETITDCVFYEEASFYVGNLYLVSLFGNQKHSNPIHEFEVIGNIHDNSELLNEK